MQAQTLSYARNLFLAVERADPDTLRAILVQYRYFTVFYIPDLSLLVTRLENGKLRSFLADILADETGHGDASRAHPVLYDDFMRSIGATDAELSGSALRCNIDLLTQARRDLIHPGNSSEFAVGLRGMGGECVCQVYIAQLYESLIKNPLVIRHRAEIDWRFWDLHVGEHDIEHGRRTRSLINDEIVVHGGHGLADLGRGYGESMKSWRSFWDNILRSVESEPSQVERATAASAVQVALLS